MVANKKKKIYKKNDNKNKIKSKNNTNLIPNSE